MYPSVGGSTLAREEAKCWKYGMLEGYVYVGTNQGLAIWGRADIVQASLTDPDRHPRAGCGDAL